jgi:hypothetical protein
MKEYWGVDAWILVLLTSSLVADERSASSLCRFISGERGPGIHWLGDLVGPIIGPDDMETLLKTKLHGLSPRVNYTDRATAACRRSGCQLLRIEGATWSA